MPNHMSKLIEKGFKDPNQMISQDLIEDFKSDNKVEATTSSIEEDETKFIEMFPKIIELIIKHECHQDMKETNEWLANVMEYNVPSGKRIRGLRVINTFRNITNSQNIHVDDKQMESVYVLAWCVEMLHTAHKLKTAIIHEESMTRGKSSWHLHQELGSIAFNDAILLNGAMYYLLKEYFEEEAYYGTLLDLFHEAQLFKSFGHCLESKFMSDVSSKNANYLNTNHYETIIKYQQGYFSFYFPIALALEMGEIYYDSTLIKNSLCKLGLLNQLIQDQRNFNKPKSQFKSSHSNSMNWYLFAAIPRVTTPEQSQKLFAINNNELYIKLGLQELLNDAIRNLYNELLEEFHMITLTNESSLSFNDIMEYIYL